MEKVYFVRHAKPDFSIHDDYLRPLTEDGFRACKKVTEFFKDKSITKVYSSPYKRAIDTVRNFAEKSALDVEIIEDFRERKIDNVWIEDFNAFAKQQWSNFDYKLSGGESLNEVQSRNLKALMSLLEKNVDKNIIIGSHGTALSTIINYFNRKFDYNEFERIKNFMPFIVFFTFENRKVISIEEFMLD